MDEPPNRPGKVRTWWHPLLASLLRWQLTEHYLVQEEVPVGTMPLQLDILLLRKGAGDLPEKARETMAGLAERLNDYTLIELKSPSDTLRAGDFQTFIAYALLYRAQNEPTLPSSRLTLIVLAPKLTTPYRDELRLLGSSAVPTEAGVWRLEGGILGGHSAWLLETSELAGLEHPLLTLVSPVFLRRPGQTYLELRDGGYNVMVRYMAQQIQQFQLLGVGFAMQYHGTEEEMAEQIWRDIVDKLTPEDLDYIFGKHLGKLPAAERLKGIPIEERLKGLAPEERLKGLAPEERLKGLAPEERLKGLTLEDRKRMRELLDQQGKE